MSSTDNHPHGEHGHEHEHEHEQGHSHSHDRERSHGHEHSHSHEHGHDHSHEHSELSEVDIRVRALESLLIEKGYVDRNTLDVLVDTYETRVGPRNGALVVAKFWTDPTFRAWARQDATAAINSLGFSGRQGEHMKVVENTEAVHNLVVCTLCSCYPWPVLGLPPAWYKAPAYRSKAVIDPRGVLADFGVTLPAEVSIRIWDSTAEARYLVIPLQPEGTQGWSEEQLAALVSRDSMIGTAIVAPLLPSGVPAGASSGSLPSGAAGATSGAAGAASGAAS